METSTNTDIIIIGAGPTGLSLACQMIRYGVDFIIVEKREGVTPFSKALGVHARTLEVYEQLDLAQTAEITGVNWFSTYKVHPRHVERFSAGRCFLAGDDGITGRSALTRAAGR